jgi:hypothetical protein
MKSSTLLALAASVAPLAAAWEITWNDADGNDHTKSGRGPNDCIKIDNPKGHLFKIDAQGETDINMLLFTNSACSGDAAGMATDVFSKDASKDLLGFKVVTLSSTASGNSTTTSGGSTATGHNATTTGTTATSKTSGSSHASSTGGSTSAGPKSTQTTVVTSAAVTTSFQASNSASSTSSSATSASTSNAAVRVTGSNGDIMKGVMGGIVGLAAWMI